MRGVSLKYLVLWGICAGVTHIRKVSDITNLKPKLKKIIE